MDKEQIPEETRRDEEKRRGETWEENVKKSGKGKGRAKEKMS